MKRICITGLLLAALPFLAHAQGTVNELETGYGARTSLSVDARLAKGLHLTVSEETRLYNDLSGRIQPGIGLSYKINKTFKLGLGYDYIGKFSYTTSDDEGAEFKWKPRHRVYVDGSAGLRLGDWRFTLRERLQLTHRDVNNAYENNPNSLALKSRLKISYKGFPSVTPYGAFEVRTVLNDPTCSATWSTSSQAYSNYSFLGYKDTYVNRLRGSLGLEWELSKRHALDFFFLTDYCYDKDLDVSADGKTLKSLTYDQSLHFSLGLGYTFSF